MIQLEESLALIALLHFGLAALQREIKDNLRMMDLPSGFQLAGGFVTLPSSLTTNIGTKKGRMTRLISNQA